ncbi:MAG: hypothetical protein JWM27_1895 [Gemmatimonadetes bacterium]|nr:hypothetical protein [Gemmatimonadota bacterium]
MRSNLHVLAAAGFCLGVSGALPHHVLDAATLRARRLPSTAAAVPANAPLPAQNAWKAARAVLNGVGIETGLGYSREARVHSALGVLGARVREQSHPQALRLAFEAYYNFKAAHPEKVRKPYLYFVDYGLDSRTPRGYVFDMEALRVVDGPFTVAHGRGSSSGRDGVPTRFSNRNGSAATSLGLFLAQETYSFTGHNSGRLYRSIGLRLTGLSGAFNNRARSRGVVVHGAPYVAPDKAGRSEGCPAMEPGRAQELIPTLANGALVFLFSPLDGAWLSEDPWAHGDSAEAGSANG